MRNVLYSLAAVSVLAAAPGAVATVTAAPGAAEPLDCPQGQYWDPTGNVCRPLGEGPQPLNCPDGQWWDPNGNVCKPLGQP